MKKIRLCLALLWTCCAYAWAAPAEIGVILMHGKNGQPKFPGLVAVAQALTDTGYVVTSPVMPWSRDRQYDADYSETLAQLDVLVADMKSKGARKIILAGHSFGANAALAYASRREGVSGIALLAPGHSPDIQESFFSASVNRAKTMLNDGKGEDIEAFDDSNQGKNSLIRTKARIYFSYFDPKGLGAMTQTSAKVRAGTAALLIIGNSDPWARRAKAMIFDQIPANPSSRYVELISNHIDTPRDGISHLLNWLKTFE
ncbi:MAG: alpha/beta hydrolase [Hylemonella sp.]|jgi:pimeloyl-ACP methyl ester carboxylesterase